MPADDITVLDLAKLLEALENRAPGTQINIENVTININQSTQVTTTVSIDYTFIDKLEIQAEAKKEIKGAFEKFTGTLKSYKDGTEGLKELISTCAKYGPAATTVFAQAVAHLQQLFPM